jgi:hypothetical protein
LYICSAVLQSCPILLCIYTYISLINNNPTSSAYHTFSQDSKSGHRATESRSHCLLEQSKSDLLRRQHLKRVPVYFVFSQEEKAPPPRTRKLSKFSLNTTVPTFQPRFHNAHSSPNFTMCDYTQVEFRCGHVRYTVRAWCTNYETTHKRCPPSVVAIEFR